MHEEIKVPVAFLRDLYEIECVSDLKDVLKKNFAEVFKRKLERGDVYLGYSTGEPYIVLRDTSQVLVLPECSVRNHNDLLMEENRRMKDGHIYIPVKDGKVSGVVVKED